MNKVEKLKELFQPYFDSADVRLFDLKWIEGKENVLEVSVIKDDGTMDLDTCAEVSEQLSAILDEADPIEGEYTLEVCSPGAEREITDYETITAGQYVFVVLKIPFKGMSEITGEILAVEDDKITLGYRDKAAHRKALFTKNDIAFIRMAVKL